MPKSRSKRTRYQPPPPPKPKPSPPWFGASILVLLFSGVVIIILNYLSLIPWESDPRNLYLWVGLGLIAVGFGASTRWR